MFLIQHLTWSWCSHLSSAPPGDSICSDSSISALPLLDFLHFHLTQIPARYLTCTSYLILMFTWSGISTSSVILTCFLRDPALLLDLWCSHGFQYSLQISVLSYWIPDTSAILLDSCTSDLWCST
jgi:hypothetical protein